MTGSVAVVGLILLEWAIGLVAIAAWAQSWKIVRRGHFRIVAWCAVVLAAGAWFAIPKAIPGTGVDEGLTEVLVTVSGIAVVLYLVAQYVRSDIVGTVVGYAAGALGALALFEAGSLVDGWSQGEAAGVMIAGALVLGGVTNGMLLGHWYLNQPGLKPWALARLTMMGLIAVVGSAFLGILFVSRLAGGDTDLGMAGLSDSASPILFWAWLAILSFTGVVIYMARRCVQIRSIQSATGLYYVALLTGGVSEFISRYLMMNP